MAHGERLRGRSAWPAWWPRLAGPCHLLSPQSDASTSDPGTLGAVLRARPGCELCRRDCAVPGSPRGEGRGGHTGGAGLGLGSCSPGSRPHLPPVWREGLCVPLEVVAGRTDHGKSCAWSPTASARRWHSSLPLFTPPSRAHLTFSNPVTVWCGIYLGGRIYFNSFTGDFSHDFIESLKGRRGGCTASPPFPALYGRVVPREGL